MQYLLPSSIKKVQGLSPFSGSEKRREEERRQTEIEVY